MIGAGDNLNIQVPASLHYGGFHNIFVALFARSRFYVGYLLAPIDEERIGDVSNVLFSNGWIADEDGTVYIYYASSDTRMHVATSTIDRLIDYCFHTPADGLRSAASVENICNLIEANKAVTVETEQVYL